MAKKDKQALSCLSCGLHEGVFSPKMQPYGNGEKGIMVIGEAPGSIEDKKGMPWQGRSGRELQRTFRKLGVDLFNDCVCVNAVNCRPPENRAPTPFELDCCRAVIVEKAIADFKPKVLILLGTNALQSFLAPRWPTDLGGIMKWRGFLIPDMDYQTFVMPTFHPSYIIRMESLEVNTIWEQDLKLAIDAANQPFPKPTFPQVHIIDDLSVLTTFNKTSEIAFDYETTGLKSHAPGHRIVCASVAVNDTLVFAFMMPETKAERKPFIDLLTNKEIGKLAHNMKFEDAWTRNRLRVEIENWYWDSMLAAHILDNRGGTTGLKFQTYINFGVVDYASEITPYLRSDGSGNGFNKIYDLLQESGGQEKLLRYCALDSHYEYLLAKKQMELLDFDKLPF